MGGVGKGLYSNGAYLSFMCFFRANDNFFKNSLSTLQVKRERERKERGRREREKFVPFPASYYVQDY